MAKRKSERERMESVAMIGEFMLWSMDKYGYYHSPDDEDNGTRAWDAFEAGWQLAKRDAKRRKR
jgi:hypothetical protein